MPFTELQYRQAAESSPAEQAITCVPEQAAQKRASEIHSDATASIPMKLGRCVKRK